MNYAILKNARNIFKQELKKNGKIYSYGTYPLVDNGFSVMIQDLSAARTYINILARIALERRGPVGDGIAPVGLSTNLSRFILTAWDQPLVQDGIIIDDLREYKIGAVTPLEKFGGIYAYQSVLIEGTK